MQTGEVCPVNIRLCGPDNSGPSLGDWQSARLNYLANGTVVVYHAAGPGAERSDCGHLRRMYPIARACVKAVLSGEGVLYFED